ncbi:hypothetical protein N5923_02895 [Erwiniaceae bacterium BAC15a-03b]|uniref:Uncharacterized protein n=1 Tax=Winslowiella arboricola TaxID=2978220 RepID=A0A9J6PL00_9GAMM|nr:hypothetical protein [Winslowiella arboricola]MCU5771632.1 hypothetical protein [Winslowiella arboricola]MCU5776445.1 hypothetical protein [Winslowiella arboricola]
MSCPYCQDLCVKYIIRTPADLRKAIRIAAQAVSEGIICEAELQSQWNQFSFKQCAEGMAWGDIVDYHFLCNRCQTQFVLGAETYHGSGGYWSPETEKPTAIID